ncbi:NAD-dependent epimerase/dehydratase family protein [Nocardia sp. alder85J]|uniref:NAD-dependent epimerase/dehydratase family protein n=1 Tax=Nocardia sp. alder85J TaxID=2862949 RepID=UPI001CD57363|nr:NAD(P)-dependent oxidoreductase [Nocardia sp. alder85J]MCX4095622.1 NAD(P)-dependent oxidoreductase [Nocardia sp. alder85J]
MKVLVTGSAGTVGSRVVQVMAGAGHEVTATDIVAPRYGPPRSHVPYIRADLTDYGQTAAVIVQARPDLIVHAAGIPAPRRDPGHVIFANNAVSTYNIAEAVAVFGVARLVYTSSETAIGFATAERSWFPDYLPVDEEHALRPQEGYALSKAVGEHICDALVQRSDATAVSVRPSLVLTPDTYRDVHDAVLADPRRGAFNYWSYVDVDDLADLLVTAGTATTPGHEVVYAAQPDNIAGRPLQELIAEVYGPSAPVPRRLDRPDAGGISITKARRLFGWSPERSWRDHVEGK